MTLRQLLLQPALRRLVVEQAEAETVVAYYEDGDVIDDALQVLRRLTEVRDEALAQEAEELLAHVLRARRNRLMR